MAQLSVQDKLAFSNMLVKRFFQPQTIQAAGDTPLSNEQIEGINGYFRQFVLELDPEEYAFGQRVMRGDPTAKLDRKRFRKMIEAYLSPILGKKKNYGGGEWYYTTSVENMCVITWVDTGGRTALKYNHDILFSGILFSGHDYLDRFISVLRWLGISGSDTVWYDLEDSKAEATAQLLAEACNHFLKAAPELLEGLSP